MGKFDKQLKYSIRKVSVGAASVVIGAFYLAMGAGVVHAETKTTTDGGASHSSPSPDQEPSRPNSLTASSYGAEPAQNPGVSGKPTESTTPKEKENNETLNAAQPTEASTSANTRGRRSKRDVGNPPADGTSNTSTGTETPTGASTENNEALDSALTERKGATVQPDQPGISIPTGNESGAHDPNAHISFDDPGHTATVEEMWKIIQHMPDDFQNNERSYLRNMDTLGRELRFDKTAENPEGVPLQPGEIRELHDFGGWHAIDKDGTQGKFVIGRKNEQGYFTGWRKVGETSEGIPIIEQGGMLGADALDNIYVHEQALDRRFDYMLMLVKGRTRANRTETVADHSTYDTHAPSERAHMNETAFNKLPFLEKDKFNKYSPAVVDYNGIEKKFTAFSTKYGSRVRVDFVTGYISDINGSKGSYRIVIKAQNSKGEETKVYDETISRVAEIVQNEDLYKKGLNVESAHANILKFLKDEFNYRVNKIKNPKVKANSLLGNTREKDYTPEQRKVYDQIVEEATEEAKKQGDIVMNVTEDFLSIVKSGKSDSEWKKVFTNTYSTTRLSNDLNTLLKKVITPGEPNSPTWAKTSEAAYKADDKAYKLLTALIPGAKKITYHVNDDQLEVETDKYTYTAARNGSQEVGIQGSDIVATDPAASYGFAPDKFATINSNTTVNNNNGGWAKASNEGYGEFSNLIGQDHGIHRTNVLTDKALSDKIIEKLGPGNEKLGRAGYFSTADIPLGTDIVSYTVQVIPSDDGRVGVNPQSSRIQYNMPILADFSVIQDTVGPSKEVARRIITKLKEQGKITGDQEKKIKEEIDKSKKTSELRSAMSGDVIVRYVDTDGNNLPITDADAKKAGEKTDTGYLVRKDVLIGTDYDVNSKKVPSFNATNGKNYALRSVGGGLETSSDAPSGSITKKNTVITFVYEERTIPPTGKGVVHFKKQVSETTTEALTGYGDITLEGNVGETFSSTEVDTKITELKNAGYEIVTNEFDTNSKTIDSTADVDGQDPSQVYNVVVREKVKTVTTPPTPDTPVDPNVPEGPKWPAKGLKESDLTKEVTRTINYFKKETADGEKIADAQPTKVDKVLYKRTATYNLVSKTVTYSGWTATADDTHTATSFSPVKTPVLAGYVADFKEVTDAPAAPNANGEVTNMTREVVYTKLGSWVPKIPGKDSTPIPYPNDPKDPTKPKYPDYPTTPENPDETPGGGNETPGGETPGTPEKPKTPELPVIPYEPGYTPKIGEKPLEPVDPKDPKKGYKVPELPNDPKKDTVIEYKPNPQKILIKIVNVTTGEEVELPNEKLEFNGVSDQVVTSEDKGKVDKKIDSLQKRGYIVSTKNPITETTKYDTKDDSSQKEPTQTYKIIVNEPVTKDTEVRKVTRTIKYVKIDVQDGNEVRTELNTEKIKTKVDKVEFSRDTTTSLATGLTKIGAWDQETKELPKVNTPVLVGYIANVVSVENKSVSPDTESYEVTVEYRKIGSWVPNLPEGVTPPAGTDMTPKPYPNNPTDPTKPKDPEYPQPGTPVEPNTPVIPYVPGYTPKIPTDPTQPVDPNTNPLVPLTPVDPNHPENGYKVPPVPTTPGNDTPITYEADTQKAIVKYVVEGTTIVLHTEELTGGSETKINYTTTNKLAELKVLGYELVTDGFTTETGRNFDKDKTVDQTFEVTVKPKVVEVTEPPTPNTPIDPENPNGPKWTEGLVNQLSLKKDVTRTITYVKKDTPNGEEIPNAKPTVTQTAHFKRNVKVNVATGTVVEYTAWTSTDNNLAAVTTEKLDGYVADKASVEGVETSVDSTDLDKKVVYTKLGSWVPRLPESVTPPTGTDMTPKPYPNNPTDPTKPGTPVYPEPGTPITPGTPVIPYVPGYTPKIGETPLQPVDPNNPGNGYKVPPVPTEPGTNTDITYVADPQKAVVKVFNTTTGTEVELPAEKVSIDNGTTDAAIPTDSVTAKIADLEKRGYVVENKDLLNNQKFDNEKDPTDGDPTQVFKLKVHEKVVTVTEPKNPNDPVDPDKPEGPKWPESGLKESDLKKEVTRTITYVKKETADGPEIADAKPTKKQTAHFKRSATYNLVTKVVTPGEWTSTDKTLEAVPTEKLDGYVANVSSVEEVETNVNSTNLDRKVVYTKLGSWIPKVPGVETPTPQPYPNHPTDPTKPGTPVYPEPGQPITPGTPVIPYVPGYTPKIGETPLQPVDPNNPGNGYKVPPVPTEPGTNTDITYAADPQKAVVKVFNTTTGTEVELPAEKVSIDNGTTDAAIPTIDLNTKIADLEKRGYVVENKDLLKDQKFDKEKDPTDGDPTQVFKLLVKERTVTVTEPKNPNDPVDPDKPEGPKWPTEGLAKSDLEKEVTRTITYVKKETANGPEIADAKPTKKQTAHFKRSATYNLVTKVVTPGEWTSTDNNLAAVTTEKLDGYVANVSSVEEVETNVNSTNLDRKVVYTKLGSWIPKVPGVETPTPLPYPNHPTDPTKPGDPTDPNTPNVPVIPYVPGYTPKIGETPLQPKVPNDPTQGYIPPAVPTEPGTNTDITYVADPQKAVVKVFNTTTGTEVELPAEKVSIDNGTTDSAIPTDSVTAKIADLEKRGYVVENKDLLKDQKFDKEKDPTDGDPTQVFKLLVKERTVTVTEPPTPDTPVDPNVPEGPKWPESGLKESDLKKEVTRTITYVKKETADGPEIADAKPTKKQTAHFKRSATYNLVTKVVTPGEWTSTDKTLEAVPTEKLDGYVANVSSVEEVETNVNSTNLDRKVVYTKLGSWVPNLPEGVTPPTGTDMTPKPYPNHPTDPTKPGTPVYPEPGQPITPGTPVIPYVPGYTPKIGETPLQPVDPNNPGNGYKVPPVPTEPGTNTDITYVADPQKAVVKVFNTTTGTEVELPAEKVSIDNGTTDSAIPTDSVTAKIADLEKRGYVVENKDLLNNQKFDNEKDPTDGDPTQVFKLKVHEKVVTVTEPKNPNDPVDPDKPEGPKWPESGLKESDLKKEVTRTITYVKKETADGPEIADAKPTVTQTAHFKRSATYNAVTGTITYGNWESADKELAKVDTPALTGYVANVSSVEEVETNVNSTNLDRKVVYTKLGSWVPNLPAGVTPPTGTDMTPKPYPNNPTDPTKPGTPVYPEPGQPITPGTPVIPYVPGYTPKTPNGNPLEPVDPNHPENGYKVPPVPTTPGNDTPITYEADTQKAIVKYVVEGTTTVLHTEELTGDSGTTINYTTANKLAELKVLGYELVTDGFTTETGRNFDKDKTVDQTFEVTVKPKVVDVPPFEPTDPKDPNKPEPGQPIDPENPNGPKWTKELIGKLATTKHVTRTITYVEDGTDKEVANKATDKVTFTRSLKVNVVTGDVVDPNVAWTSNDTTFDEVTSPVVKGYILKANQGSEDGLVTVGGTRVVASENLKATSENQNLNVVYTKLGSWVPNLPEGVTPPTGTDMTPKPYPNNPTDPTKPKDPEYPQPGTPVEPNTPVIPYVPGYTPKIPTDPTQPVDPNTNPLVPLTPVDPNHPENGYKVPPVPTTPGEDTPITYEGNPQKALVKVVKVDGTTETPLTADYVNINGKTGDQIPTESVTAKIAELEKRGYVIDNRDEVVNYINNKFDKDKDTEGQDPTQTVTLKVHEKVVPVTPPTPEKPLEPGQPIDPDTPVDPNNPNDPTIPRWTDELIKKLDVKKEVTRTINYVDEAGNKVSEPSTDKVTFIREAKINVVTGKITYGEWKAVGGDTTFDKVSSPVVKGYILKDPAQKEVAERKGITPTVANQTIEVVYKKLGSWVPKVPGVETPTPLPYPNTPTDPTKPGDPTDPTTPNVPVIPYVPGYTPKTPDGNPLVPVDPNDPTQGYIPPVPTEPGQDTPIEYVKVPNTPSPEEPVKPTPESNHITIWVDENGKPLKPEKPGTHEPGNIPGYRYITTVTKDGVTIHKFEKITPVDPYNPVPQKPTTPIPTPQDSTIPTPESQIPTPNAPEATTPTSETNRREELPNTGTEANASLASAGIMTLLAGLGLGFFKKKEEDESE